MKIAGNILIVVGSALAAFGLSGWQLDIRLQQPGQDYPVYWAAWLPSSQIEITLGVVLLVIGLLLRADSKKGIA